MPPTLIRRVFDFYCIERATVICRATATELVARSYPSPALSVCGHVLLTTFWFLAVVLYGVFVSYQWFTTPDTIITSQSAASEFEVPQIGITAYCTNAPNCGVITITANYSGVLGCQHLPFQQVVRSPTDPDPSLPLVASVPLCYTGQNIYTTNTKGPLTVPGILVDFTAVNPGLNNSVIPNVATPSLKATGVVLTKMIDMGASSSVTRTVSLDSWQVRSLTYTRRITSIYGVRSSAVGIPLAVQYEGRRPNWRATLLVVHAPYVYTSSTQRTNNLNTVVGVMSLITSWSGMIFFIGNFMGHFVTPLVVRFFTIPASSAPPAATVKSVEVLDSLNNNKHHKDDDDDGPAEELLLKHSGHREPDDL